MSKLIVAIPWTFPNADSSAVVSDKTNSRNHWEYDFVLANHDATNLINSSKAPMELLPSAEVTVLVAPAKALSWHQIDLPKVPRTRMRSALDGLLEERLLDDTQALAFALAPDANQGKAASKTWVAVCEKAWLSNAISLFESNGHRVTQVVPEFSPAHTTSPESVFITGVPEDAYVTRINSSGILTLPLKNSQQAQHKVSSGHTEMVDLHEETWVHAEPAVAELAEKNLSQHVTIRQISTGLLQCAQSNWDLAQFENKLSGDSEFIKRFRRKLRSFWVDSQWRPVRWGLLGIFLVNVIGLNAWAWHQKSSLAEKKSQVALLLTQSFPNVKTVVDPQLQMDKEMALLRQAAGAVSMQSFETLLSVFSLANQSGVVKKTPNTIEFTGNKLVLTGIELAANELTAVQAKLKQSGYAIKMEGDRATITWQAGS